MGVEKVFTADERRKTRISDSLKAFSDLRFSAFICGSIIFDDPAAADNFIPAIKD
jgi:hypothetical protein